MIIGIIADSLLALFSGEFDPEVFFESLANGFRALIPSAEQFKNGIKNIGRFLLSTKKEIRLYASKEKYITLQNPIQIVNPSQNQRIIYKYNNVRTNNNKYR